MGKESSDSGTQEREDSDHGSHDSRAHSAPTAAEEPTHRTPSMEDAPSDSGARGQRRSAIPSSHHQEQPRLERSPGTGTPPPLSSASRSMDARLEQARRRQSAAQAALVRRRHRLELHQRSVDDAETEGKEASEELRRVEWAVAQQARTNDSGAVASSTAPVPVPDVHSRSVRMGDEAFFEGSVAFMASQLRHEFRTDLGTAVFDSAAQLLTSVRQTSSQAPELLSVRQAWSAIDHSSWRGQLQAGPTLALVTALRRAHDAAGAPVFLADPAGGPGGTPPREEAARRHPRWPKPPPRGWR